MRAQDPDLILIGAGGYYGRPGILDLYRGRFLADMMIRMGYDAVAVGASDLAYDLRAIREDAGAGLPLICANLYRDGRRVFPPYIITGAGGSRVGIFALLGDEFGTDERFEIRDPLAEGESVVAELRRRGCAAVILVAHMRRAALDPVLAALDGVDLVIRGHAQRHERAAIDCADTVGGLLAGGRIPALFAGDKGRAIGRAVLSPLETGAYALTDTVLIAPPLSAPRDSAVAALLEEFRREDSARQRELQVSEFVSRHPITGKLQERYLGLETCARCHGGTADDFLLSPHFRAFQRLNEAGQERNPSCLPCHSTGYGRFSGYDPLREEKGGVNLRGVQCEACHGPGTAHTRDGEYRERARRSCRDCHDARMSPHFVFQTFWSRIGHRALADTAGAGEAHR